MALINDDRVMFVRPAVGVATHLKKNLCREPKICRRGAHRRGSDAPIRASDVFERHRFDVATNDSDALERFIRSTDGVVQMAVGALGMTYVKYQVWP